MICTSKRRSSTPATVRLTPFTATDPFRTMYEPSSGANTIVSQYDSPSCRTSSTAAVASTWPCTKWPPRRASARNGRSRLTIEPRRIAPSVVTRAVSGDTSKCTPCGSVATTVRHTPFTATLSPLASSVASGVVSRRRKPPATGLTSVISPIASTSPVNIALHQLIVSQLQRRPILEDGQRKDRRIEPADTVPPRGCAGLKYLHAVDEVRFPHG